LNKCKEGDEEKEEGQFTAVGQKRGRKREREE